MKIGHTILDWTRGTYPGDESELVVAGHLLVQQLELHAGLERRIESLKKRIKRLSSQGP